MFSKIIFALAMVCVVNASVLTASDDDLETKVEASLNRCDIKACDWVCRRLNMTSGSCVEGHCKCEKSSKAEDEVSAESFPISELSEDLTKRRCDMRVCHQFCRSLKLSGGVCVNGRCKCDHFFGTEEDAVDEYSELATRRICKIRKCSRTCTRHGYAGASCVNGVCNCRKKIKSEEASPLNDVTSDENEESNEILTNEGELTASAPSACNTVSCNQMCHRLQYAGGWCRSGQCQCY